MASYRELLRETKQRITEIQPEEAEARLGQATFVDVREQDEHDQGTIPGSVFIPRGHLESQAETKLLDRDQPIVLYCAGGNRSAFAAETLEQLGFTDVVSMAGGFGRWKNEGRPWITPQTLTAEQRDRYGRHILLPEVGEAGQQKLLESRVLLLGAGGLGSPAALYLAAAGVGTSASSTWTSSTRRTCSARSCTTPTASASARSTRPRRRSPRSTPTSTSSPTTCASAPTTCSTSSTATTSSSTAPTTSRPATW